MAKAKPESRNAGRNVAIIATWLASNCWRVIVLMRMPCASVATMKIVPTPKSSGTLPRNGTSATRRAFVATGLVEVLLWIVVGYLTAMVIFEESLLALVLALAGLAAVALTLRSLGAPHRTWGFTLAMLAVFPTVFAVAMLFALVAALILG